MYKGMKVLAVALSTAMLATGSANAATVVLDSMTASWQNTVGGHNVDEGSGNPAELSWGSGGTSKYRFSGNDPVTYNLPPTPTASKSLGTLTHFNQSINNGSAITKTQLKLTTDILVDGSGVGSYDFVFDIFHDETNNVWKLWDWNCCDDEVTFGPTDQSQSFTFGGMDYTLYLTGFGNNANNIKTTFYSEEGQNNSVKLWGYIDAAPVQTAVPEPSTWAMMIGGLGLVGMTMRRRKTTVSFA